MLTYTGVFCAVSLIIDRAARHGAQQTGFLAVGVLETMLLAASLTVLLRLPAPEGLKGRSLPQLWPPCWSRCATAVFGGDADEYGVEPFGHVHRRLCLVYQIQVLELTFFEIMVWVTAETCAGRCALR